MADEEDDWFESAFKGEETPEEPAEGDEQSDDDEDESAGDEDEPFEGDFDDEFEASGGGEDEAFEGGDEAFDPDAFEESGSGDGGDAFESEDGADAFESEGGDEEFAPEEFDGDAGNPFDDEGSGDDLFDDDFSDAFAGADDAMGGGGGFGMGGSNDGFESEDFESDIPRLSLGIEGLDDMIQGGVPERSLMVVMGSAGTGKTTFGLQFIGEALEKGERAAFITLEESHERIVSTAQEKGWDFEQHIEDGDLAIVDLDPVEMANSLASIRNELPGLVDEFGASRLVLDSVSLLELMYDDQATRRTEVYQFTKALKEAGVTTMVTSEASSDDPFTSRYGIIEYLTDAVFVLRYIRGEDFRETRLAVEIQKIRDANHSRETKPYEITNTGISVYRQANIF